jgi:uncharacterized protein YaaQ
MGNDDMPVVGLTGAAPARSILRQLGCGRWAFYRGEFVSILVEKLLVIIAAADDADRLLERMIAAGYPATKISSTGGFLRRGSATILSGVGAGAVDQVMAMVHDECEPREEYVPVQTLPFPGTLPPSQPLQVRAGGAIVFVLDVQQFEKI